MIDDQYNDRPDDSDKHAVKIETGDAGGAQGGEDEASDNRSDYAKDDVEKEALTGAVDDFAGDEPGDEAQDDPTKYGHFTCLLTRGQIPRKHAMRIHSFIAGKGGSKNPQ